MGEVFSDSCVVSWKPPESDGGSALTHYVVEMCDGDRKTSKWSEAGEVKADKLELKIAGLEKGRKYKFRVQAQNKVGLSEPAGHPEAVEAKDPWSESGTPSFCYFLPLWSSLYSCLGTVPPDPPMDLEVTDWDKDRVDLKWRPPLSDGGAPISGYVVECKERFSNNWVRCAVGEKPDTDIRVTDVIKEGKTYEFRVSAVNKAGVGKPSEPTVPVAIKPRFVKPFIVNGMADKVVKVGQILSWDVNYGGEPEPEVAWFRGSEKIEPDGDRITVDRYSKNTVLTVRRCERGDSAKYRLVLTNGSGTVEVGADGVVLGKPSRPQGPMEVEEVRAKRATVKWGAPSDDGGTPVTHFLLEKMDVDTGRWVPCGEAPADAREAVVDGLQEGKKYKFRVRAVNREGSSEPLESGQAVEAKNPYRVPDPPRNLQIFDWDNKSVTLRWDKPRLNSTNSY